MKLTRFAFLATLAVLPSLLCMGRKAEGLDTISARSAFIDMPSGVLDLLSKDTRLDMLDYFDNDSIYRAHNNMRGISYLEKASPDFLSVRLTPVSCLQLKVLKLKNGSDLLMTIYTTGGEGESLDSDVEFYDAAFNRLDKEKYFPTPKLSDFFNTKGYKTKMKEIEEILPFYTIQMEATPESQNLTGRITYGDVLTVEDSKIVELFAKPSVTFLWNGKSFRPEN